MIRFECLARNFGFLDRLCRRSDAESFGEARLSSRSLPARDPFRVNFPIRGERGPHTLLPASRFNPPVTAYKRWLPTIHRLAPLSPRERTALRLVGKLQLLVFRLLTCTATAASPSKAGALTFALLAPKLIRACFLTLGAPATSKPSGFGARLLATGIGNGQGS